MKTKHLIILIAALLCAPLLQGQTDRRVSELPAASSLLTTDIIPVTVDPGGSPVTKKATIAVLFDLLDGATMTFTNKSMSWGQLTGTPTTLSGYGITDAQGLDSDLTAIAALTTTSTGRGLLDDADASALRTSIGVVIGTDVQAYDADLTTYAGITPSANVQSLLGAANYAAMRTQLSLSTQWELVLAVGDETTDLTTGNAKLTFRLPDGITLTEVRASVNTAPVGSTIIVDVNEAGSTVLSTKVTIDASEETSTTAATPAVISDATLADDAEITIDIDQVGSSTAGKGLKIILIGTRTP